MESFEDLEKVWKKGQHKGSFSDDLDKISMEASVKNGVKRERSVAMEYFWGVFIYHIIAYALLGHVLIRFFGDTRLMLLSVAGIAVYIPFTTVMMKKFKAMCVPSDQHSDIQQYVKKQYDLLSGFFRFKKIYEWVSIPVISFILVAIIFSIYVDGGVAGNLLPASGLFIAVLGILTYFIYRENKKHFIDPLQKYEAVLKDLNDES